MGVNYYFFKLILEKDQAHKWTNIKHYDINYVIRYNHIICCELEILLKSSDQNENSIEKFCPSRKFVSKNDSKLAICLFFVQKSLHAHFKNFTLQKRFIHDNTSSKLKCELKFRMNSCHSLQTFKFESYTTTPLVSISSTTNIFFLTSKLMTLQSQQQQQLQSSAKWSARWISFCFQFPNSNVNKIWNYINLHFVKIMQEIGNWSGQM